MGPFFLVMCPYGSPWRHYCSFCFFFNSSFFIIFFSITIYPPYPLLFPPTPLPHPFALNGPCGPLFSTSGSPWGTKYLSAELGGPTMVWGHSNKPPSGLWLPSTGPSPVAPSLFPFHLLVLGGGREGTGQTPGETQADSHISTYFWVPFVSQALL